MSNERTIEFIKTEIKVVKAELKRAVNQLSYDRCTPIIQHIIDLHKLVTECESELKALEEKRGN